MESEREPECEDVGELILRYSSSSWSLVREKFFK